MLASLPQCPSAFATFLQAGRTQDRVTDYSQMTLGSSRVLFTRPAHAHSLWPFSGAQLGLGRALVCNLNAARLGPTPARGQPRA